MKLVFIINVLTVLEVIVVEFISIWTLSKKRSGFLISFLFYAVITIFMIAFMYFIAAKLPGYGNGSGGFMSLGALYLIPAIINYGGNWKIKIIIAFYSFSYGLMGFAIAVRIGYLFPEKNLSYTVFIAETLFYLLTFGIYLSFSKTKVIYIAQKADKKHQHLLMRFTITSFILIITYNNVMVADANPTKKLLIYLLLTYFLILTYRIVVSYLTVEDDNQELNSLAMTDKLTGLSNRLAFRNKCDELLNANAPFALIFMDLDCFKRINDYYGHSVGDQYLANFALALKKYESKATQFFRISGDEFVCLTTDPTLFFRLSSLEIPPLSETKFLGVSMGIANYPDDGTNISILLREADSRMYAEKKRKNNRRRTYNTLPK